MYGSHESSQFIEVISGDDGKDTEFQFTLTCVTGGDPGQYYGPAESCHDSEAAEFELDTLHALDDDGNPILLTYQILEAIAGKELAQKMYDNAVTEALESGDF